MVVIDHRSNPEPRRNPYNQHSIADHRQAAADPTPNHAKTRQISTPSRIISDPPPIQDLNHAKTRQISTPSPMISNPPPIQP